MTSSFWGRPAGVRGGGRPGPEQKRAGGGEPLAGQPLARAERVDNYLGLPGVTGMELWSSSA